MPLITDRISTLAFLTKSSCIFQTIILDRTNFITIRLYLFGH